MIGPIRQWPVWQRAWVLLVLGGFWLSGAVFAWKHGNSANFGTDETGEQITIFAANHYIDHGFFENYLLPTYPPFGHAPDGSIRKEPFVYNHYLAGQDLTLALWLKALGKNALWSGRLIPHAITVFAMAALAAQFGAFVGSSLMGCILLGLLMVPRSLTAWSICLYGHSYVMAFYLLLFAGMFRLASPRSRPAQAWALGIAVGIGQMLYDFDWVPLTLLSAASFACMVPELSWKQGRRLLGGLLVGAGLAGVYQLFISSLYYNSPLWVIGNIAQWMRFRAGVDFVEGVSQGDFRLGRVLQEYNRQAYGATGFTALELVGLSLVFLVLGYLGRVKSRVASLRVFGGIALAYLAAVVWNVFMRQHSVAHTHFLPRHYFVLYLNLLLVALPVSYELVRRSRMAPIPVPGAERA